MKSVRFFYLTAIIFMMIVIACQKEYNPVWPDQTYPVVRITSHNYYQSQMIGLTPHSDLFEDFCQSYDGRYSDALKAEMVLEMKRRAFRAGEDPQQLQDCLDATGRLAAGVVSLPYYAEKACYEDQPVWLIEFAWGYSAQDLGHFKSFVMDLATFDTLYYVSCR